ncbi:MAG: arginine decarboxylase [Devosia sp.]|uniref:hypothetical protein n=1 Tax=Devosia sp. TaxID=1871048 RepID=UPI00262AE27C|nr:hypothetical protein [Devosia sp.]MDB5586096.1 arginine decarboxylase [Devosia sp.]
MLADLIRCNDVHEYSWHTPGHTGGTAFLKTAVGRIFYDYFALVGDDGTAAPHHLYAGLRRRHPPALYPARYTPRLPYSRRRCGVWIVGGVGFLATAFAFVVGCLPTSDAGMSAPVYIAIMPRVPPSARPAAWSLFSRRSQPALQPRPN